MKTLPLLVTITTVLYIFLLSVDLTQANAKRKYAPAYCLKFRLNCASQQKKKHVCCMYPLPNTKGGSTPSQLDTEGVASTGVSASVSGVSVRPSFRPLRLAAKTAPTATTSTQAPKANDDNVEKSADVKKNSESATGLISKRPSIRFKTKPKTPAKKKSKKPTKEEQKKGSLVGGSKASSLLQRQKRPRICLRLVINCRSNPEHRCCVTHETDEESTTVPAAATTTSLMSTSTTSQETLVSSPTTIDSVAELKSSTEPATITEEAVVPSDGLTPLDDPNFNVSNLSENRSQISADEPLIVATVEKVPVSVASTPHQVPATTTQTEPESKIDNPVQVIASSADELVEEERRRPPYQRIAAECFTMVFNCQQSPQHMCCPYQQHM